MIKMKIPKKVKQYVMNETLDSLGNTVSMDPVYNKAYKQADRIARKAIRKALRVWVNAK